MTITRIFLVSMALVLVAACGDKGAAKLTEEQKATFRKTIEGVGRTQDVAVQTRNNRVYGMAEVGRNFDDEPTNRMVAQLLQRRCLIDVNLGNVAGLANRVDNRIFVRGLNCPVELTLSDQSVIGGNRGTLEARYRVIDEEFKKLHDVTAYELTGRRATNLDGLGRGTGEGEMKGTIISREHGSIAVDIRGKLTVTDKMEEETIVNFRFPAFSVEMKRIISGSVERPDEKFSMNGEELTKAQFKSYFEKGGLAFPTLSQ